MPSFHTTRRVAFSDRQMFDLVADVESYPLFLPLCEGLMVEERTVDADGHVVLLAAMTVGYGAIRETFKTRVLLKPEHRLIAVDHGDGPFSHLRNDWTFQPLAHGCDVQFSIDYAFRSPMLGLVVGAVFDRAFRKFVVAFEERAAIVYGAASHTTAIAR